LSHPGDALTGLVELLSASEGAVLALSGQQTVRLHHGRAPRDGRQDRRSLPGRGGHRAVARMGSASSVDA